tara:strand:- start:1592 stop:2224 length:633 start_codon:yes stop_codon:yes gene_type:complete
MEYDYKIKIILCGNTNVGKSTFFHYIQDKEFHYHTPTIGVDYFSKLQKHDDYFIKLNMWDTAGQEKFRSIVHQYFRDVSAAILMFDLTNLDSLNDLNYWINMVKTYSTCNHNHPIFLFGSKKDLINNATQKIDGHLIENFINKHDINYYQEISTFNENYMPQQIIYDIIEEVIKQPYNLDCKGVQINNDLITHLNNDNLNKKKTKCCIIS